MAISADYAQAVQVNGFTCRNCTDVGYAKKHVDPDHPKSGPFNVNAGSDPTRRADPAFRLDGALAFRSVRPPEAVDSGPRAYASGQRIDLAA